MRSWIARGSRLKALRQMMEKAKKESLGVSERFKNIIQKVRQEDKLVFYVMQTRKNSEIIPSRIAGTFEAVSEPFKDSAKIFKKYKTESTFPYRVKIKPLRIFDELIEFKKLVPKLGFIKNKRYWVGSLRRAMILVSEKDYRIMVCGKPVR